MVFSMVRPTRRDGSPNAYFRRRIPADLLEKLKGRKISVRLAGASETDVSEVTAAIGHEIKFSLQTADPRLLRARHAQAQLQIDAFFEAVRTGPKDLSAKQIQALAGEARVHLLALHDENPPQDFELEVWADIITDAERLLQLSEGGEIKLSNLQRVEQALSRLFDVEGFLTSKAVELSVRSRRDFLQALLDALVNVVQVLRGRLMGNYSPDREAERYPVWTQPQGQAQPKAQQVDGAVATLDDLFERWRVATRPAPSTVSTWQGYLRRFATHLGHKNPHTVTRSDALRWKDALLVEGKQQISKTYLGALRALYAYGVENSETTGLKNNPFAGVKAKQKAVAGTGRRPFTDDEVGIILKSALKERLPYLRWVPWLQAQTGARVGEIAQLWGDMIVEQDGVTCIHIRPAPDGGTIKNAGSERIVPLHPVLIEDGFIAFVRERGDGPLFYRGTGRRAAAARDDGASKHPSKGVANRIAGWIRELGVTDPRTAPTHSFRHWTKTALQKTGCPDSLADKIQGHAPRSEGDTYRHAGPQAMLEALRKLDLKSFSEKAEG